MSSNNPYARVYSAQAIQSSSTSTKKRAPKWQPQEEVKVQHCASTCKTKDDVKLIPYFTIK